MTIHVDGCEGEKTAQVIYIKEGCPMEEEFSFMFCGSTKLKFTLSKETVAFIKIR